MSIFRNRAASAAIVAVAAGALTLTACGGGGGSSSKDNSKTKDDAKAQSKPVVIGDAKASTGPAPEVPGAKPGGVATVYQEGDFSHLDPGQIYVSDGKLLSRLIYRGLTLTGASRASLFLYTAPFFVVIGARWFLPGDRFDRRQWLGLVLSFTGIVAAFGVPSPGDDARQLIGDLMLVLAGASWGATTLVIKATSLARAPYEKTLLYQLVVSVPMLAACAEALGERVRERRRPIVRP